jgi:hypothetical protein
MGILSVAVKWPKSAENSHCVGGGGDMMMLGEANAYKSESGYFCGTSCRDPE